VDAQALVVRVDPGQENLHRREGEGIREEQKRRGSRVAFDKGVRPAEEAQAIGRLPRDEVTRLQPDPSSPAAQPEAQTRPMLDLLAGADDGFADATDQAAWLQVLVQRAGDSRGRVGVMRREENRRQIGRTRHLSPRLVADFLQGAGRRFSGREGGCERHTTASAIRWGTDRGIL
jgi:hypothetical protein